MSLCTLPDDLLQRILTCLPPGLLPLYGEVSKRWNALVQTILGKTGWPSTDAIFLTRYHSAALCALAKRRSRRRSVPLSRRLARLQLPTMSNENVALPEAVAVLQLANPARLPLLAVEDDHALTSSRLFTMALFDRAVDLHWLKRLLEQSPELQEADWWNRRLPHKPTRSLSQATQVFGLPPNAIVKRDVLNERIVCDDDASALTDHHCSFAALRIAIAQGLVRVAVALFPRVPLNTQEANTLLSMAMLQPAASRKTALLTMLLRAGLRAADVVLEAHRKTIACWEFATWKEMFLWQKHARGHGHERYAEAVTDLLRRGRMPLVRDCERYLASGHAFNMWDITLMYCTPRAHASGLVAWLAANVWTEAVVNAGLRQRRPAALYFRVGAPLTVGDATPVRLADALEPNGLVPERHFSAPVRRLRAELRVKLAAY